MTEEEISTENKVEEVPPMKVEITNKPKKETPYEGEESYQYEDMNPTKEELEEDFGT